MTKAREPARHGTYHDDFRLSITKALGDQLSTALTQLVPVGLTPENLKAVSERPGVYQLYLLDEFIYVGKAEKSLRSRLGNHLTKLTGRRNIDIGDIKFSCLYVDEDFSALAPEQLLISHHKEAGEISWNNNGFGNKDPGRQRDSTILKKNHFDVLHPIDVDHKIRTTHQGRIAVHAFLKELKNALPYNFRYAEPSNSRLIHLTIPSLELPANDAFRLLSSALGGTWQITALMGYVIMYEEAPKEYKSACRYYQDGKVVNAIPEALPEDFPSTDNR